MNAAHRRIRCAWLLVVCLAVPAAYAEQSPSVALDGALLWRIENAGGGPPSHLFGTIHSDDPQVATLTPAVTAALDASQRFVMEVVLQPDALLQLAQAMMLPPDQDLRKLLGESDYRKAAAAAAERGLPEPAVARLKPWALLTTISMPPTQSGAILDLVLYERALAHQIEVHGLETMHEQIAVLDELPMDRQIKALQSTLEHLAELPKLFEELYAAYRDRDLARMSALSARYMEEDDQQFARHFQTVIIDQRNLRMFERMRTHLAAGGAFIAVGALHLPGEHGLLALLRDQGYRLTAID